MTQPHHRNRHPKYRKKYKIHNWRAYERSLINLGDLTLWLSEDVIQSWSSKLGQRNLPDHTTLSRRNSTLKTRLKRIGKPSGRVDFIIESTGLVIHGEGRWIRHKHGKRKRRGWRKLHI